MLLVADGLERVSARDTVDFLLTEGDRTKSCFSFWLFFGFRESESLM